MEVLMGIILFASAVLNIILFFKIWGMTNDVAAIKKHLIPDTEITLTELVALGEPSKAESAAKKLLYDALSTIYFSHSMNYTARLKAKDMDDKLSDYLPRIQRLGVNLPEHLTSSKAFIEYMNELTGKPMPC